MVIQLNSGTNYLYSYCYFSHSKSCQQRTSTPRETRQSRHFSFSPAPSHLPQPSPRLPDISASPCSVCCLCCRVCCLCCCVRPAGRRLCRGRPVAAVWPRVPSRRDTTADCTVPAPSPPPRHEPGSVAIGERRRAGEMSPEVGGPGFGTSRKRALSVQNGPQSVSKTAKCFKKLYKIGQKGPFFNILSPPRPLSGDEISGARKDRFPCPPPRFVRPWRGGISLPYLSVMFGYHCSWWSGVMWPAHAGKLPLMADSAFDMPVICRDIVLYQLPLTAALYMRILRCSEPFFLTKSLLTQIRWVKWACFFKSCASVIDQPHDANKFADFLSQLIKYLNSV